MKPTKVCLMLLTSLTLVAYSVQAQTDSSASTNAPAATPKPKAKRFTGKIASVDSDAKTITLEGPTAKTIKITSHTKIYNNGQPGTLADAAVGLHVSGASHQD